MVYGIIAFILAVIGAGWLLVQTAQQNRLPGAQTNQQKKRHDLIIKVIIWLSLCAGLLAANLWPLSLMVLISAGGVTAIEYWKQHSIEKMGADSTHPHNDTQDNYNSGVMSEGEALQILGLEKIVDGGMIREAHRKLISKIHPDSGGNDYLASKINNARDVLLKRAKENENKNG